CSLLSLYPLCLCLAPASAVIYTLSLHDALPISVIAQDKPNLTVYTYDGFASEWGPGVPLKEGFEAECGCTINFVAADSSIGALRDRKSTRLNSSHVKISYAVFCLKKKKESVQLY